MEAAMTIRRSAPYKVGRFTVVKEWLEPVQCFAESSDVDSASVSLSTAVEAPTTPTTATDDSPSSKLSDLPSPVASCCSLTSEEPKQQQQQQQQQQMMKHKMRKTKTTKNDASLLPTNRTSSAGKIAYAAETKLRCLSRSSSSTSTSAGSDFRSLDSETSLLSVVASP